MNITAERLARATAVLEGSAATSFVNHCESDTTKNEHRKAYHNESCDCDPHHHRRRRRKRQRGPDTGTYAINTDIPSCVSKRMELNEWAVSLLFVDHVHPPQQLSTLMDEFFLVEGASNSCSNSWKVDIQRQRNHHPWIIRSKRWIAEVPPRDWQQVVFQSNESTETRLPATVHSSLQ